MKYLTRVNNWKILILGGIILMASWLVVGATSDRSVPVQAETKNSQSLETVYLQKSSLPIRVSGIVRAVDQTIISAQTAGVVTSLPAREGVAVWAGQTLSVQNVPVESAGVRLAREELNLSILNQASLVDQKEAQVLGQASRLYSAEEIAQLRAIGDSERLLASATALKATLDESALTMIGVINYVNNNRSFFSSDGLRLYDRVVANLYKKVPIYFSGGVTYTIKDTDNLLALLKEIKVAEPSSVASLEALANLMESQLEALKEVLVTAEKDVFERGDGSVTADTRQIYLDNRAKVIGAKSSIQSASANLRQTTDQALEIASNSKTAVVVSGLDKALADSQLGYARQIADASASLAQAGLGLASAKEQLGYSTAPFAGVVGRVLVAEGQYVQPGTPLLTLIGEGGREVAVSVPSYLLSSVAVGQSFVVDGQLVGVVSRVGAVGEGASVPVVIALVGDKNWLVGSSVIGALEAETGEKIYSLPRSHLFFDAGGPYIIYENGDTSSVEIVYDAGEKVFVMVQNNQALALKRVSGVSL